MDDRTLFYVTEDEVTKRSNQLGGMTFGQDAQGPTKEEEYPDKNGK